MYDSTHKDLTLIIELLENESQHWSAFFKKALVAFENGDYIRCGDIILSGSGGMGSLNDLVLGQSSDENGNFQWKPNYKKLNDEFQKKLNSRYAFSRDIRHATNK